MNMFSWGGNDRPATNNNNNAQRARNGHRNDDYPKPQPRGSRPESD